MVALCIVFKIAFTFALQCVLARRTGSPRTRDRVAKVLADLMVTDAQPAYDVLPDDNFYWVLSCGGKGTLRNLLVQPGGEKSGLVHVTVMEQEALHWVSKDQGAISRLTDNECATNHEDIFWAIQCQYADRTLSNKVEAVSINSSGKGLHTFTRRQGAAVAWHFQFDRICDDVWQVDDWSETEITELLDEEEKKTSSSKKRLRDEVENFLHQEANEAFEEANELLQTIQQTRKKAIRSARPPSPRSALIAPDLASDESDEGTAKVNDTEEAFENSG